MVSLILRHEYARAWFIRIALRLSRFISCACCYLSGLRKTFYYLLNLRTLVLVLEKGLLWLDTLKQQAVAPWVCVTVFVLHDVIIRLGTINRSGNHNTFSLFHIASGAAVQVGVPDESIWMCLWFLAFLLEEGVPAWRDFANFVICHDVIGFCLLLVLNCAILPRAYL